MGTRLMLGFGLVGLTLVAAPLTMYMAESSRAIQSARLKNVGIAPLKAQLRIVQSLQRHRGLSAGVLGGNMAMEAQRAAKRTEVNQAIEAFDAIVMSDISNPAFTAVWRRVVEDWRGLANGVSSRSITGQESFVRHTALINEELNQLDLLLDYFGLSYDPSGKDYHLVMAILVHIPQLTEFLGQLRARGSWYLASKTITPADRTAVVGLINNIERQHWNIQREIGKAVALNPHMTAELSGIATASRVLVQKAVHLARSRVVDTEVLRYPPAEYWAVFTQATDDQFRLIDKGMANLERELHARIAALHNAQFRTIGLTALVIACAVLLGMVIVRTLKQDIAALKKREETQRYHAGELEVKVEERTQQLQVANAQLEAASRHKSAFLANMSHELRTPLNTILGFAALLHDPSFGLLSDKQSRYVSNIHSSGEYLLALINDLLDLAKVEAGKLELRPETFVLHETLTAALEEIRVQAEAKQLRLELQVDERLSTLTADPVRVTQILLNFLSNAVKVTPEGGRITVTARKVRCRECGLPCTAFHTSDTAEGVEIAVQDTGIGIAAEDMPKLFQPFVQLETALIKPHRGTGLGLALVKQLVELHGGRVWVASEGAGRGSTFTICLPLCHPHKG